MYDYSLENNLTDEANYQQHKCWLTSVLWVSFIQKFMGKFEESYIN